MQIVDIGLTDYEKALELQQTLLEKRSNREIPDTLIVTEHFPVVTLGRLSADSEIFDRDYFRERNIPIVRSSRGGKATFHAPGQIVIYPIVDLSEKRDVSRHIDLLEKAAENGLKALGVKAMRINGKRGVWVGWKKIAFTGVALKRWVAYHGISVNVNNDVEPFSRMSPCGEEIEVTSAMAELGRELDMAEAKRIFAERFVVDLEKQYRTQITQISC